MIDLHNIPASPVIAGILGVCVGDALGLPVQFESRRVRKKRPVTEMIGYGVFNKPPGSWSDDSSLTLCLVDALTQVSPTQPDQLLQQTAQNFCRWYTEGYWTPFEQAYDIGGTTAQAMERLLAGVSPQEAGGKRENNNGNGSLMRILPLAFCYQSLEFPELIQLTHDVSAITHGHLRSQIACGIYISIAVRLLEGDDPQLAYENGIAAVEDIYNKSPYNTELPYYNRVISGKIAELQEEEIGSSGYVVDALEASLWCFLTTTNYKDAVLKSVNLGEDTDTTAAIAGGLGGIYYGVAAIPSHWLQQLAKGQDILDLVKRFNDLKY
jgi:ADP-ribosyl-[dinitrogen reductase] hydrolase